jgi:hypothetical protein
MSALATGSIKARACLLTWKGAAPFGAAARLSLSVAHNKSKMPDTLPPLCKIVKRVVRP